MKFKKSSMVLSVLFSGMLISQPALAQEHKKSQNKNARIIGGQPAKINEHPWMVALIDTRDDLQFCGGSLIAEDWVMTAAHCLDGMRNSDLKILLGSASLTNRLAGREVAVSGIFMHEDYFDEHDIALVRLAEPVTQTYIPMASRSLDDSLPEGTDLVTSGWGLTSTGANAAASNDLLEVEIQLSNRQQCIDNYRETDNVDITDEMICAGSTTELKDSCSGDSGGPLTYRDDSGSVHLLGVVSFGSLEEGCASLTHPGIYTRVSRYDSWIDGVMNGFAPVNTRVNLGGVGESLSVMANIEVVNNGDTAAVLQGTALSGDAAFRIVQDNCEQQTVAAGETCEVTVELNSQVAGDKNAELHFDFGDRSSHVKLSALVLPEVNLGEALDNNTLTWFSGGASPWRAQNSSNVTGQSEAVTGNAGDLELSVLSTAVTGPGELSFRWRVSSEQDYDFLNFRINGETIERISGEQPYVSINYSLPEGSYIIEWSYEKDESLSAGDNRGYLDDVQYTGQPGSGDSDDNSTDSPDDSSSDGNSSNDNSTGGSGDGSDNSDSDSTDSNDSANNSTGSSGGSTSGTNSGSGTTPAASSGGGGSMSVYGILSLILLWVTRRSRVRQNTSAI